METDIFFQLALVLVVTKSLGLLSRRIHLPQVVGALFAGILLGPAIFGLVTQGELINGLAEIGVILLMFEAGLETDVKKLKEAFKPSLLIALFGAVVPLGGGFLLSHFFHFDILHSLFIGVILTATSISITVETLHEMDKLKTKAGTAILGAAVIDDILGIIILSIIISIGAEDGSVSISDFGGLFARIAIFFILAWIIGYIMLKLLEIIAKKRERIRRLPIFSLAFCFFMAFLADRFGIADITGAYFAGLALSRSRAEHYVEEKSNILSYMFFSPIFFVSVGLHATFDGLNANVLLFSGLLLLVAVAAKFAGCSLGALICRFSAREGFQIGAGMVSRGEVAIIIATKGLAAGLLVPEYFSGIIIIIIITTLITPLLLKLAFTEKKTAYLQ